MPVVSDRSCRLCVEMLRLVDEHDRDLVPDLIKQTAPLADKAVFRPTQAQLTLALRARQYLQQFLTDSHHSFLPIPANISFVAVKTSSTAISLIQFLVLHRFRKQGIQSNPRRMTRWP